MPSGPDIPGADAGYARQVKELFTEFLAAKGLRLTSQRMAILEHQLSTPGHQSMEEVYRALKKRGIGRATVFRTLKLLEECRLVRHMGDPKGNARFELHYNRPHHDHLICIDCGLIQETRWPELERIQQRSCRKAGFEPLWHRHEVFGRCSKCRRERG